MKNRFYVGFATGVLSLIIAIVTDPWYISVPLMVVAINIGQVIADKLGGGND